MRNKLKEFHELSFISKFVERMFFIVGQPNDWIFSSRSKIQNRDINKAERIIITKRRGLRIELWISFWIILEILALAIIGADPNKWYSYLVGILMAVRIIDIVQAAVNLSLFDFVRIDRRRYLVEHKVRTIVLSALNFIEIMVCFGFVYSKLFQLKQFNGAFNTIYDGYYFSAVTQLTIGYGDISPCGIARYVAVLQGLIGFMFTLLILSRLISVLPNIDDESEVED